MCAVTGGEEFTGSYADRKAFPKLMGTGRTYTELKIGEYYDTYDIPDFPDSRQYRQLL